MNEEHEFETTGYWVEHCTRQAVIARLEGREPDPYHLSVIAAAERIKIKRAAHLHPPSQELPA